MNSEKPQIYDMPGISSDGSWNVSIPIKAIATPRPSFRTVNNDKVKAITFYSDEYYKYLEDVRLYLINNGFYNDGLRDIMLAEYGVSASFLFFMKTTNQKTVKNIFKKTAPDLDNLAKGIMDAIFFNKFVDSDGNLHHGLKTVDNKEIRDSRVVSLTTQKYSVIDNPRILVKLKKVGADYGIQK